MELCIQDLSKKYTLKTALDGITITFGGSKIHAILGENGAGKSTLVSILSGSLSPSGGKIFIDGIQTHFVSAADAMSKGIYIVRQRPVLAENLTVLQNILLGTGIFTGKKKTEKIKKQLAEIDPGIVPDEKIKNLGGNRRFYTSLAAALIYEPKCLILDEPSAFLDKGEREKLYKLLKTLAKKGMCIIVITHSRAEAAANADTVTVLNEGKLSHFYARASDSLADRNFFTEKSAQIVQQTNTGTQHKICLEISGFSCRPKNRPPVTDAGLQAYYGEICAVTSPGDSSLKTFEDALCGMEKDGLSGTVSFFSAQQKKTAIKAADLTPCFLRKNGTAVIPSDKTYRASNPSLTVAEMLSVYTKKDAEEKVLDLIKDAAIEITPQQSVSDLSGGMLQRLILARELSTNPSLVIMCNPMQGLDAASQKRLCERILSLVSDKKAVILIGAEDFPLTLCSRVYTLESGILKLSFSKQAG